MGTIGEPTFELLTHGRRVDSVAADALPLALADLHRNLAVDAAATLAVAIAPTELDTGPLDIPLPQESPSKLQSGSHRHSPPHSPPHSAPYSPLPEFQYRLGDAITGAGFEHQTGEPPAAAATANPDRRRTTLSLRRTYSLADTVGPNMKLLICGLNPSPYSAEIGVGFGRPGNRFWPAAIAAGLTDEPHDPRTALTKHGVGMTDLVKRPTRRADELSAHEYRAGVDRVRRLTIWLQPKAVCFVGLAGWRTAVDRKATAGWQAGGFGGVPVYLMPSTSGLNASSQLPDLTAHLREAVAVNRLNSATATHQ